MKITVIGTGYVGLVSGACLADVGNDILCFDVDVAKVEGLRAGNVQIFEPGLDELVRRNVKAGRLSFTHDAAEATAFGTLQFVAVGTPPGEDGSADLQYVLTAARAIGRHMTEYRVVVDKSTVPVGTADKVREAIAAELVSRGVDIPFSVVSNPEFLKEGAAVNDFMKPDRIIVGSDDDRAIALMRALYAPFQRNHERFVLMDVRSAELTKYAANAMLATRISFMNEMANLAERLGADIESVRKGIGSDPRIGNKFLFAGAGFGGSCFPKDLRALRHMANGVDVPLGIVDAAERANERQKRVLGDRVLGHFGGKLEGKRIALWGLAFKPETDDIRESPALVLIEQLRAAGANIVGYDPAAMANIKAQGVAVELVTSAYAAAAGADALVLVTEWHELRDPDLDRLKAMMRTLVLVDGRNVWPAADARAAGFTYYGIGRA